MQGEFRKAFLFAALLFLGVQIGLNGWAVAPADGHLPNADSYTRVVRLQQMIEAGEWYEPTFPRSGPPPGEALHWTHPMDALLGLGAVPLALVLPLKEAILAWGRIAMLLVGVGGMAAFLWAARPFVPKRGLALAAILYPLQPSMLATFNATRIDHHGLIMLIFSLMVGAALRLMTEEGPTRRQAAVAGLSGALGIWVSLEMLIPVVALTCGLVLPWLVLGRRRALDAASSLWGWTALGLLIALPLERSPAFLFQAEPDRVSVMHLTLAGLAAAALALLRHFPGSPEAGGRGVLFRTARSLVALAVAAIAMKLLFPDFFKGPMAQVDPRMIELYWHWEGEMGGDSPMTPAGAPLHFGTAGLAMGYFLWRIWRREGFSAVDLVLAGTILPLLFLPPVLGRWTGYQQIVSLLPAVALLGALMDGLEKRATLVAARVSGKVLTVVVLGLGSVYLVPSLSVGAIESPEPCVVDGAFSVLGSPPWSSRPRLILTGVTDGPGVLFNTPHRVLTTGHHRSGAGMVETFEILAAADDAVAEERARRRGVDMLLVCRHAWSWRQFAAPVGGESLYHRLTTGRVPSWLESVALPPGSDPKAYLYAVRGM